MRIKNNVIRDITNTYELYGFEPIETPVLELWDVLSSKGGDAIEDEVYKFSDKGDREVESWSLIEHRTNRHRSISHRIGNFHTTKIMSDYVLSMLEGKTLDDVDEIVCRNLYSNRYYRGDKYFDKIIEHIRYTKDVKHYPEKEFNTRPYWLKY